MGGAGGVGRPVPSQLGVLAPLPVGAPLVGMPFCLLSTDPYRAPPTTGKPALQYSLERGTWPTAYGC